MLTRSLLMVLAPAALAGGTLTSWLGLPEEAPRGVPGQLAKPIAPAPLQVATGRDTLIHATVHINGHPIDMIVDTGASQTLLSERDAQRVLGADAIKERSTPIGRIRTINGPQDLYAIPMRSVKLGGRLYRNLTAGRVAGGSLSVLGLDWLELAGPVTLTN